MVPEPTGRVRERRCRHSLPSEPDVRVSPHPAQAATKPRVGGTGATTCHLYDTRLQPPCLAFTLEPVNLVPVCCLARGCTHGYIHVHLLFLLRRFYRFSRNERPCWKSARLRGGVETATPIRPVTGRLWLSPAFLCPPFPQRSLRSRLPRKAECRVYHVSLEQR